MGRREAVLQLVGFRFTGEYCNNSKIQGLDAKEYYLFHISELHRRLHTGIQLSKETNDGIVRV